MTRRNPEELRPRPHSRAAGGRLFAAHARQAHQDCGFDVLLGTEPLPEPEIH